MMLKKSASAWQISDLYRQLQKPEEYEDSTTQLRCFL